MNDITSRKSRNRRSLPVAGAVALAITLLLAGCSEGVQSADSSTLTQPVPDDKAQLEVWTFLPENYEGGEEAYEEVVAEFEQKYPQVEIKMQTLPYPTYFDSVRSAIVAGKGPDVITMYGGAQAYSYRSGLLPLQDAILPDLADDLSFVEDSYSKDGNLYVIPTGTFGYALLINQDKFAEAGIDPVAGLATWDRLLETCRAMASKGIHPIASGWKDGFLFETFMYMITTQLMDPEAVVAWTRGTLPVDNEIFVTATELILDMNEAQCFGGEDALGRAMYDDAFNQYYAGEAAMAATASLSTAETAYASVPNTTVLAMPQAPGSQYSDVIEAGPEAGWSVTRWTRHPEAAGAFVNFLASTDAQQTLWDMIAVPPNLKSLDVASSTPIQEAFLPLFGLKDNHSVFASYPLPVLATYERNAAPLVGGSMSVEDFTAEAQAAYAQGG